MCISERLKKAIELKKISSIKEFAEISDLPYRTAQSYLNGDREPNVSGLTKICTHLGINLNWLLLGTGDIFVEYEEPNHAVDIPLSDDKKQLIDVFDDLTPEQRRAILEVGRVFTQSKPNKEAG
ncbi:hypothetical protein MASR2M36_19600 [Providencia sp.]